MRLCIIPARGGSKRIPRKNIKAFCGKPMLAYAVEAAHQSGLFDEVYVSTDDTPIAELANSLGALVIERPHNLADDYASTVAVMRHAIEHLGMTATEHETALLTCLYPCVPFLQVADLHQALEQLYATPTADYVFPVAAFPSAIQRALRQNQQGNMSPFFAENVGVRTQDLEPAFYDAGQFYVGRLSAWWQEQSPHLNGLGLELPSWRVVDVDTPEDWQRAELIYKALFLKEVSHDQ